MNPLPSEVFGRIITHFPRVHLDVEMGLTSDILGLVYPWFQSSVLEDGYVSLGESKVMVRKNTAIRRTRGTCHATYIHTVVVCPRPDFQHVVIEGNPTDRPVESKPDLPVSGRAAYRSWV